MRYTLQDLVGVPEALDKSSASKAQAFVPCFLRLFFSLPPLDRKIQISGFEVFGFWGAFVRCFLRPSFSLPPLDGETQTSRFEV